MAYVVKTNKGYIKRTSQFGQFHGSIILTDDSREALRFTRIDDADRRGWVAAWRTQEGDGSGHWKTGKGRDYDKFDGPLTFTIEEQE